MLQVRYCNTMNTDTDTKRPAYGIKSERLPTGIVWHVMRGWRDDASHFATWTHRVATYTNYNGARRRLRQIEASSRATGEA